MKDKNCYTLLFMIAISTILFSILGSYWNMQYYHQKDLDYFSSPPLASAMRGLHDKLYLTELHSLYADYAVPTTTMNDLTASSGAELFAANIVQSILENGGEGLSTTELGSNPQEVMKYVIDQAEPVSYNFTTASEDYFNDACFIGDSRTVGISQYAGIEGATFLCQTSLSIYDYEKPKITYEGEKTSVHDVLTTKQFAKIYLMLGINECGTGTAQYFFEHYRAVVEDIRRLQPDALIFIQGNLLITQSKSDESTSITNANLMERNAIIATLANQHDIFYIDINESSLCENGALVPEYTWDQIHIKAQYYPIWKSFLLEHAIITN